MTRPPRCAPALTAIMAITLACAARGSSQEPEVLAHSVATSPIALHREKPTEIRIAAAPARPGEPARSLSARLDALDEGRGVHLVLVGIHAGAAPGITYNVYLDPPEGARLQGAGDPHAVGTFSFFDAIGRPRDVSFEIGTHLPRLRARGAAADRLRVVIAPAGVADASAAPAIDRVELVVR